MDTTSARQFNRWKFPQSLRSSFSLHLVRCSTNRHHPAYGNRRRRLLLGFWLGVFKNIFEKRRVYVLNPKPPWPEFSLVQDFLRIFIILLVNDGSSELSFPSVTSFLFLFPRRFIPILNGTTTTILHFPPTLCFPVSIPHDFCMPTIHTLFQG